MRKCRERLSHFFYISRGVRSEYISRGGRGGAANAANAGLFDLVSAAPFAPLRTPREI